MPVRPTITLSDDLNTVAEIRRKQLGYRTKREYVEGLIRYDGITMKEHRVTAIWAAMDGHERDAMDAAILRQVKSGRDGEHRSYLEAEIRRAVAELQMTGVDPTTQAVAKKVSKRIAEGG